MVKLPEEYPWSSYGANGWGDRSWLTPHQEYQRLGRDPDQRCASYRELFTHHVSDQDLSLIRKAAHYCQPVSDDRYRKIIEEKYGLRSGYMKRGRPRQLQKE